MAIALVSSRLSVDMWSDTVTAIAVTEVSQPARRRRSELLLGRKGITCAFASMKTIVAETAIYGTTTAMIADVEIRNTTLIYYSKLRGNYAEVW